MFPHSNTRRQRAQQSPSHFKSPSFPLAFSCYSVHVDIDESRGVCVRARACVCVCDGAEGLKRRQRRSTARSLPLASRQSAPRPFWRFLPPSSSYSLLAPFFFVVVVLVHSSSSEIPSTLNRLLHLSPYPLLILHAFVSWTSDGIIH